MGVLDISRSKRRSSVLESKKDVLNISTASSKSHSSSLGGTPTKSQSKYIKSLFASFGLTPPPNVCKSGSPGALWFSSKFEKKMASFEDESPSSPLATFQRYIPSRASKAHTGPFKATQIWNEVIFHLKEKVEVKKRRHNLRNYHNCFTGTDAVDVVLHYLLSDQENFCNLSREKAVKLCQSLMDKQIFRPAGSKSGDTTKHHFEDSSGKLYHFCGEYATKGTDTPTPSDTEDETEGRASELCDDSLADEDSAYVSSERMRYMRIKPGEEADLLDDSVICNPVATGDAEGRLLHQAIEGRNNKRKIAEPSESCCKRQKLSTSRESLHDETPTKMNAERLSEIQKEVALCQLLTIIELSFLDGVLGVDDDKTPKKLVKRGSHSMVVSNIVAKHWNLRLDNSEPHSDRFMRAALDVIRYHIPRGVSKFDTDFSMSCDPVTKLQAYNMVCEHYNGRLNPLFPDRFIDLHVAVMNLVFLERNQDALRALQLDMILLSQRERDELKRLLTFMAVAAEDNELPLEDTQNGLDNESVVLINLTSCILKHKGLAKNLAMVLVQFLTHHVEEVFTVPADFTSKVELRLQRIQKGEIPVVEETVFCNQVTSTEYQQQTEECTDNGLMQMMNSIVDDPKMALKAKKQRLRQFRKYHPHLFNKHFAGMV